MLADADLLSVVRAVLPEVTALYVFGSRAAGTAHPASDIDLAVLLPGRPDVVALWEAGEDIARRVDTDVDLIDLRRASTVLQHQIVTTGRRLFAVDGQAELYEAFIVSEMLALDEARSALIAEIRREGQVHGR